MRRVPSTMTIQALANLPNGFSLLDSASEFHPKPYSDIYPAGCIAIPNKGCIHIIELKDILYVEADSNYTRFYTQGIRCFMMAKTLKQVSQRLVATGFLRIHQSFMVHPGMIRQYVAKTGMIVLKNGDCIPVSRANRKWVVDQLMCYTC